MIYRKVVLYGIDKEKRGVDYRYSKHDAAVLKKMLDEINKCCGKDLHWLAEIDAYDIPGAGPIMAKYLEQFEGASIRCYLIPQIIKDMGKDCAELVLSSYLHFKNSNEYISGPNEPSPAHIHVRYDNAFKKIAPKKLKEQLMPFAFNHRDAFYLPLTMGKLASWKIPSLESVFASYLDSNNITNESVGLPPNAENYYPSLSYIRQQLRFTAIYCLKYYPSGNTRKLLNKCIADTDKEIASAARKSLDYIERKNATSK